MLVVLIIMLPLATLMLTLHNEKKKITLAVMKMADNHLRNVYCHHHLKHGGSNFPYFD